MRVSVNWKEALRFEGSNPEGFKVLMDGDKECSLSPMELVLSSLGGCTGIDILMILEKMRLKPTEFGIEIEGERAEDHPKVFSKVNIVYVVKGTDIPEEKLKRAIDLTQEKYCSVLHMVNKTAEIVFSYKLN